MKTPKQKRLEEQQKRAQQKPAANRRRRSPLQKRFSSSDCNANIHVCQVPVPFELMEIILSKKGDADITVIVERRAFACHKTLLKRYTSYFDELETIGIIELPAEKVSECAFDWIYNWMLGEPQCIQRDTLLHIYNAAQHLKIVVLQQLSESLLSNTSLFREDTAFMLYLEARRLGMQAIMQQMLTRISKFFLPLVATKDFLELKLHEVVTLLSSDKTAVNREMEIFFAGVRWLNFNWKKRKNCSNRIIKCVRFKFMSPQFLAELAQNQVRTREVKRVCSIESVQRMLYEGIASTIAYMHDDEKRLQLLSCIKPRVKDARERFWIIDSCCFYHDIEETLREVPNCYANFINYLKTIRAQNNEEHWKNLNPTPAHLLASWIKSIKSSNTTITKAN